uniref:AlNc14C273G9990 protein n=1 Tax=Albugo laibachii Nc14 TaxID=890382 RepID=F0WUH9_9STRA|nr:AlNc14C273G9990 [Albugo laibachii Nc14]|eukprot:CCA25060.1 AlNc14C273G9990 [Albugo laibachii Nc14]
MEPRLFRLNPMFTSEEHHRSTQTTISNYFALCNVAHWRTKMIFAAIRAEENVVTSQDVLLITVLMLYYSIHSFYEKRSCELCIFDCARKLATRFNPAIHNSKRFG